MYKLEGSNAPTSRLTLKCVRSTAGRCEGCARVWLGRRVRNVLLIIGHHRLHISSVMDK